MRYQVVLQNILIILLPTRYIDCEIVNKIVLIANEVYNIYEYTSVVWYNREVDEISDFLKLYKGAVMTINLNVSDNVIAYNDKYQKDVLFIQTIFFTMNPKEFQYFVETVNPLIITPIRVIVIFLAPYNRELINNITEVAWNNDVGDILILSKDTDGNTIMSTYMPYGNGICGNHTAIALNFDIKNIFPAKFKNFYGCPIRVTTLHFLPYVRLKIIDNKLALGGLDGRVITFLIEQLNATMNIVDTEDHGGFGNYVNNTAFGSFGDLVNNMADVMVPSIVITNDRYKVSQVSYVISFLEFLWCLPKRREIYHWAKVLLPFYNDYTPFILLSFGIYLICIRISCYFKRIHNGNNIFMTLFGIFFAQAVKLRSYLWLLNIIYITWIWFSFVVRIAYQGQLINGLQRVILEPRIETVEEALNVYKEFFSLENVVNYYRNTSMAAKFKAISINELPRYIKMVRDGEKIIMVLESLLLRIYPYEFEILNERVAKVPLIMSMRPRWPVANVISHLLEQITETGIKYKVISASSFAWVLKKTESKKISFAPLEITTLGSVFYGLILIWIFCSLILCIEIIYNKLTKLLNKP